MVFDICVRVKDLGDVCGSFIKATHNSVYLGKALISKTNSVVVSLFKIEKKYIISISRMTVPSFESFTNAQLLQIIELNIASYTETARRVINSRSPVQDNVNESSKLTEANTKNLKEKKENKNWNQFKANKEMFGVEPEFSMDEYAEAIDRTAPGYKELKEFSHKIANEINSQGTNESRTAEDKWKTTENKTTEDELYSSVVETPEWNNLQGKKGTESSVAATPTVAEPIVPKVEHDLAKEHENFKNVGWTSVCQFLSDKKKKDIVAKVENSPIDTTIQSQADAVKDKSVKQPLEQSPKSFSTQGDAQKQTKSKEKKFSGNGKKGLDKVGVVESKPNRAISPTTSLKFPTAEYCIRHIIQNIKNNPNDKARTWGHGQTMAESFVAHSKPLSSEPFPSERMDEVKVFLSKLKSVQYKN